MRNSGTKTLAKFLLYTGSPLDFFSLFYLRYHTLSQIVNGVVLGIFIALFWFLITDYALLKGNSQSLKNLLTYFYVSEFWKASSFKIQRNFYLKIVELKDREKELSKIKNNLEEFTSSLDELDFIKEGKAGKKNK